MLFYLVVLAVVLSLSTSHEPPKTPPSRPLDKSQFIQDCMTYGGQRVGECMAIISEEA